MAPVTENHKARLHGGLVHSVLTPTSATAASTRPLNFEGVEAKKKNIKVQNNPHWMTGVMWRRSMLRCEVRSRNHLPSKPPPSGHFFDPSPLPPPASAAREVTFTPSSHTNLAHAAPATRAYTAQSRSKFPPGNDVVVELLP